MVQVNGLLSEYARRIRCRWSGPAALGDPAAVALDDEAVGLDPGVGLHGVEERDDAARFDSLLLDGLLTSLRHVAVSRTTRSPPGRLGRRRRRSATAGCRLLTPSVGPHGEAMRIVAVDGIARGPR